MKSKLTAIIELSAIVMFSTVIVISCNYLEPAMQEVKTQIEESQKATAETVQDEITEEEISPADETVETLEEKATGGEEETRVPSIEIKIKEGPIYSTGDNICFYRIEAAVTGNPYPSIAWSKDGSNGACGDNICQVNLYNPIN